jgi:hypothetical protein
VIEYRAVRAEDLRFVVESFLDSYRDAHAAGLISWDTWHEVMRPQWQRVLARPGVAVTVAAFAGEAPGLADLAGWIAVERDYLVPRRVVDAEGRRVSGLVPATEPLVHYVFVKAGYRKAGIARGLFRAAGVDPERPFRHTTKTGIVTTLRDKVPYSTWAPLIARHPKRS